MQEHGSEHPAMLFDVKVVQIKVFMVTLYRHRQPMDGDPEPDTYTQTHHA